MKKIVIVLLTLSIPGALAAQSVVELFQKAKGQVKAGSCDDALKTLDALDVETAKPGHEAERKQVDPPLAFYRGVCNATLGKKDEAKAQFIAYFGFMPNASIDASAYPRKAVTAFEEARKELGGVGAAGAPSIASSYSGFKRTAPVAPEVPGEDWANGPVRAVMSDTEKREYSRMSDAVSRSEFVTKFW